MLSPEQMLVHSDGVPGGNPPGFVLIFTRLKRNSLSDTDKGTDTGTDT